MLKTLAIAVAAAASAPAQAKLTANGTSLNGTAIGTALNRHVVVSAHASVRDRNPAFLPVIDASVLRRSRVERASRSSRVTITTSPGPIPASNRRSELPHTP